MLDINNGDTLEFKLENYIFTFNSGMNFEIYNVPNNYYGIIFHVGKCKYDVLHSVVGNRILINNDDYENHSLWWKDVPLNDSTLSMLPDCIKVRKI